MKLRRDTRLLMESLLPPGPSKVHQAQNRKIKEAELERTKTVFKLAFKEEVH